MHSFNSPGPVTLSPSPLPADRRPPTSRAHRSALRTFAGWDRGCAGVAAGLREPPYGTEVLYAVQAGSMKPGHTIPSAQGARDFSYVEMHPPFSSPFSRHIRVRESDGCDGVSVAARGDAASQRRPPNVASWYNRNRDPSSWFSREKGFDFPSRETLSYPENINVLTLNKR